MFSQVDYSLQIRLFERFQTFFIYASFWYPLTFPEAVKITVIRQISLGGCNFQHRSIKITQVPGTSNEPQNTIIMFPVNG